MYPLLCCKSINAQVENDWSCSNEDYDKCRKKERIETKTEREKEQSEEIIRTEPEKILYLLK